MKMLNDVYRAYLWLRLKRFYRRMMLATRYRFVSKFRLVLLLFAALLLLYTSGAGLYLFEKDYFTEFSYPMERDVLRLVNQLKSGRKPDVEPINEFKYGFKIDCAFKCRSELRAHVEPVRLLLVVKSALTHFENRKAIRETWGWEKRFSDVEIRRVFLLGKPGPEVPSAKTVQSLIDAEHEKHMDVVQGDFVDSYFNNTIKTMLGFHWVVHHCPKVRFVLFVDDDYYVSTKNVLRYLRRSNQYPNYLQRAILSVTDGPEGNDGPDDESSASLFTGYRFFSKPLRLRSSKWFMTLEEYPYSKYPPYLTAGAYLMTLETLRTMYFASYFTKPFRFDDIYLGILAKKCGVEPLHNPYFFFHKPPYTKETYTYLIACHGYDDPEELRTVWNEQRTLGNA